MAFVSYLLLKTPIITLLAFLLATTTLVKILFHKFSEKLKKKKENKFYIARLILSTILYLSLIIFN